MLLSVRQLLRHRGVKAVLLVAGAVATGCRRAPAEDERPYYVPPPSEESLAERSVRMERERALNASMPTGRYAVVVAAAPGETAGLQLRVSTMGRPLTEERANRRADVMAAPTVLVLREHADTVRVSSIPQQWIRLTTPAILEVPGLISELELAAEDPPRPLVVAGEREIDPSERWVGAHLALRRQGGMFVPLARTLPLEP